MIWGSLWPGPALLISAIFLYFSCVWTYSFVRRRKEAGNCLAEYKAKHSTPHTDAGFSMLESFTQPGCWLLAGLQWKTSHPLFWHKLQLLRVVAHRTIPYSLESTAYFFFYFSLTMKERLVSVMSDFVWSPWPFGKSLWHSTSESLPWLWGILEGSEIMSGHRDDALLFMEWCHGSKGQLEKSKQKE